MRIIHWFRRDLRLIDNPALTWAARHASALTLVYIHVPEEEAPWQPGAASRWWLDGSLRALEADLARQGQRLIIRRGPSHEALEALIHETGAEAVSWNRLYEPALIARDSQIKATLRKTGITAHSANAQLLCEPWTISTHSETPYRVFTPFWKAARRELQAQPVDSPPTWPPPDKSLDSQSLAQLGLHPGHAWADKLAACWQPGEAAAQKRLSQFIDEALTRYPAARDLPADPATSKLSPYLHFGEIGPRQILAELSDLPLEHRFITELGWREFAHHLLHHYPHTPSQEFNPRFAEFPWRDADEAHADLARWQRGETGIELVDAGMRELWQTGWMHNRVRMVVGSFLTKNLGIDWRCGARWFWDTLVDASLANNTLGWQWIAGCGADAAPYFRIFNPDSQAEKFDPRGEYRQRWLQPPPRPAPMVDLKASRARALETYGRIKCDS